MSPELHRAVRLLHGVGRRFPDAWDVHNQFRASRAMYGDWPEYVFAPRQAARLVVAGDAPVRPVHAVSIQTVGTLAAWRPTQGIYRFDAALLDALWSTAITGDLPGELLHRLPEWCVYIELGRSTPVGLVHGVWARIGFDTDTREEELDLLVAMDDGLRGVRLPLRGTLEQSLRVSLRDGRTLAEGNVARLLEVEHAHQVRRILAEPVLSVVLYLCSANAELRTTGGVQRPRRPAPRCRDGGEPRWVAAPKPVVRETGTRLGAALRRARDRAADEVHGAAGGLLTQPHIRRAHWHTFWVGGHDSPDRRRDVRWLPPIPVNLDEGDAPDVATVRRVHERA